MNPKVGPKDKKAPCSGESSHCGASSLGNMAVLDTSRRPSRGSKDIGIRVNESWPETKTYGVIIIWGSIIVSSSRECNINKRTIRIV